MKHLSKMTETQMREMTMLCETAAVRFAQKHNFSGLSHHGWFNFYAAIQDAIKGEWVKAKTKPRNVCGVTKVWNDRVPVNLGEVSQEQQAAEAKAACLEGIANFKKFSRWE